MRIAPLCAFSQIAKYLEQNADKKNSNSAAKDSIQLKYVLLHTMVNVPVRIKFEVNRAKNVEVVLETKK